MINSENLVENKDNTGTLSQQSDIFTHIFYFPWIPFKVTSSNTVYEAIGEYGSVLRLTGLTLVNSLAILQGLVVIIGNNPFIALRNDLRDFSFNVAYVSLIVLSFLMYTTAQFLCFRIVSGKGSIVAQGYIASLSSANFTLLYWLTIALLFITRIRGIDNLIIIGGGLYLLYPSLVSLQAIHKLSIGRFVFGIILSIVISIPIFILYLYLFDFLRRARPYEVYDWRSMMIFTSMALVVFLILVYMFLEQRISTEYSEGVPIFAPFKEMLRVKWVTSLVVIVVIGFIAGFAIFNKLDTFDSEIKTERHPFWISSLPTFDPDLMFVLTRGNRYGDGTQIEVWQLSSNKRIDTIDVNINVARLRPSEDGSKLILSNRQSPHGDALIFDPETKKLSDAKFDYLENYGILNPYRDDVYYTSSSGGIRVERNGESKKVNSEKRYFSVAVHPNNKILFFIAGNFIDIVDIETLEVIDTIKIGGSLRDLAVSPDGEFLYITDALWNRVITIPSPTY